MIESNLNPVDKLLAANMLLFVFVGAHVAGLTYLRKTQYYHQIIDEGYANPVVQDDVGRVYRFAQPVGVSLNDSPRKFHEKLQETVICGENEILVFEQIFQISILSWDDPYSISPLMIIKFLLCVLPFSFELII